MIRIIAILFFIIPVFLSCGKNNNEENSYSSMNRQVDKNQFESAQFKVKVIPENLTGTWINIENNSGFELLAGGKAVSVNMKVDYISWDLIENKLVIISSDKNKSGSETEKEIYIIKELFKDSMLITPSNKPDLRWTYTKKS